MEDDEPTQNLDVSAHKDEEDLSNICDVFYSGMRVMAGAYLLDRLRLALSIYVVTSWQAGDGEFHQKLYSQLENVKMLKGRIENRRVAKDVDSYLQKILQSLESLQADPPQDLSERYMVINGIYFNCLDIFEELERLRTTKRATEGIDKTWCIQESPLLKEAMVHINQSYKIEQLILDLGGDLFKDFSQRMKVAAVHGILINRDYGLPLFKDIEKTGFCLFEDWEGIEGMTAFDLLDYIHDARNKFAHTTHLDAREEIAKFVMQFDKIDEFLDQYFKDVDLTVPAEEKRKCLKHLFSDIPDYMTTNKLTNAYENFKKKLIVELPELRSENERLQQNFSQSEKEMKQRDDGIWSAVEEYYEKHNPTPSTDEVYKKLLKLVRNTAEKKSRHDQLVTDLKQVRGLLPDAKQLSRPAKDITPQMPEGAVNTKTADESSQAVDVVGGDFGGQKQDEDEVDCLE